MATNQEKFDELCRQVNHLFVYRAEIVKDNVIAGLDDKVKDNAGEMKSVRDLVRDGGGVLRRFPWYGSNGKVQPKDKRNTTSLADDIGWEDYRSSDIGRKVLTLQKTVESLALSTGAVIDLDAIAKAVNDEEDRRNLARLEAMPTSTEEK